MIAQDRVIIIGSQAILGSFDENVLPADATMSIEVDIAPLHDDDAQSLATLLDGVLGEWSPFHETHGFYVQGVGRYTAVLPSGWEDRLVTVQNENTIGRIGLCLEPHDLCIAKLAAAREKDFRFVGALRAAGLVDLSVLRERAALLPERAIAGRTTVYELIKTGDLHPIHIGRCCRISDEELVRFVRERDRAPRRTATKGRRPAPIQTGLFEVPVGHPQETVDALPQTDGGRTIEARR